MKICFILIGRRLFMKHIPEWELNIEKMEGT